MKELGEYFNDKIMNLTHFLSTAMHQGTLEDCLGRAEEADWEERGCSQ